MISDEIRSFVKRSYADEHMDPRELLAIADRVDRELVELPKDMDWVPIHVNDLVYADGVKACVTEIDIKDDCYVIDCWDGSKHVSYHPSGISHDRHDSFERIADELDNFADANYASGLLKQGIKDFSDRIRKLTKEG